MSYCLNPDCPQPKNPLKTKVCKACGSSLLLHKRYLPIKKIGQGGFGATFLAVDIALPGNPTCVIKQLQPATNVPHVFNMAKELFEREAETLGKIGNHPQIPRLLDYFENKKQFYLVQEFVRGHNLQQEVKQNGPFSEAGVKQFLQEIMPMIGYIHEQEVIHRDIKPANIIRREEDKQLVLIDFGAVKNQINTEAAANLDGESALTSFAIGTPGFAPPEQMAMRPVFASDIYAIGITVIYLLTGKQPKDLGYNSTTGEMLWQDHVNISNHLSQVLAKMIEGSVRHRYKSAPEVLEGLNMEGYHDSLAQSMVTAPTPTDNNPSGMTSGFGAMGITNANLNKKPENKPPVSASEKLARQIRARRSRMGGGMTAIGGNSSQTIGGSNSGFNTGMSNSGIFNNSAKEKKKVSTPINSSKALLEAYANGRRDFAQQNFNKMSLKQAELSKINFHESSLIQINLEKANLTSADFGKANLSKACLLNANLGRAYLGYANLTNADLRGADLSFATLTYANLKGANLCGANLANAKVTEQQLEQAKTNWRTVYPNGKRGLF